MISFIIPTYNSASTIERSINSILNQKSNIEYEIIVVNDGSTDQTDNVMKKFSNNKNVKYFVKENSGVADTRNYGLDQASGEYIIFVDSDDYISPNLLSDIQCYINESIDLIKWNAIYVNENNIELKKNQSISFEKVSGEQGFNLLFGRDNLIDCLWNYAIKKDIIMRFPSGTEHEDFAVMPLIILKAKSFVSIEKYEYFYVQSQNSIMRNNNVEKNQKRLLDKLNHFDNIISEVNKMNIQEVTKQNISIWAVNSLLNVIKNLTKDNKKYYTKELKKRNISQYIKCRNIKQIIKKIVLQIKY